MWSSLILIQQLGHSKSWQSLLVRLLYHTLVLSMRLQWITCLFAQAEPRPDQEQDLAELGWRIAAVIVKKKTDKYGKAGDRSNLLVRYATTEDVKNYKAPPPAAKTRRKRRTDADEGQVPEVKRKKKKRQRKVSAF
jgi:hypothetical protein